jgi:hypothetical protein
MTQIEFESRLWLSSVQLVRVDDQSTPTGIASGALIDYHGKRVLLTVAHATGDQARWAIQIRYVPGKGTQTQGLGSMHFLKKASIAAPKVKPQDIDFSYVEVPPDLRAFRQELNVPANTVKAEVPITVHTPTLTDVPTNDGNYGFCGLVLPTKEEHFGKMYMGGEIRIYSGLKFVRTEEEFHYFSLPFPHPGREHFEGCSGAPVFSEEGALVGLLCGGDTDTSEVRVISVNGCKTPIDILVGNVR